MMLYLQAKLSELRLAYFDFFHVAYMWKYQKDYLSNDDCAQFALHGVIPGYVQEYLKFLQEKDHEQIPSVATSGGDVCPPGDCLGASEA